MTTDKMEYSYFSSLTNTAPKLCSETWEELCDRIANKSPTAATKSKLPLIKLATFHGKRSNATLAHVTGIEADYDGEVITPEEAAETLRAAGVEAFIYTSPSHEDWAPRWRVLCPLSRPHFDGHRSIFVGRLNAVLGGVLAAESFTPSQAFYIGAVQGGNPVQSWRVEGSPIDTVADKLPATVYPKSVTPPPAAPTGNLMDTIGEDRKAKSAEDLEALIDRMGIDGEKHIAVRDFAARYAGKGYSREDCEAIVRMHCPVWNRDVENLIDTAYAKFYNAPAETLEATDDIEWPTPTDIIGTMPPPEFPLDTLPPSMRNWVEVQSRNSGNDPAGYAIAALVTAAAALPDHVRLVMKRSNDGWRISARLWGMLVGPPSARKSPVLSAATRPLHKIGNRYFDDYDAAKASWEAAGGKASGIPQPALRRVAIGDATPEGAQIAMATNENGLLMDRDELSGWLGAMEPQGGNSAVNPARSFWLTTYDGKPYITDRVQRGVGRIKNASVCVLGGIQPDVIEKWKGGTAEDGLIQRFIPVMLRAPGIENHQHDPEAAPADAAYSRLIEELHQASDCELRFTEEAQDRVSEILDHLTALGSLDVLNSAFASFIGKMPNTFGSLCILLHMMDGVAQNVFDPQPVEIGTVERALRIVEEFILKMGDTFYFGILDTTDPQTKSIAECILALPETVDLTTRLLAKNRKGRTAKETTEALDRLESLGWVMRVPQPRERVPHWIVNPRVHADFAEHAAREKERREKAVKKLAQLRGKRA